MVERILAKNWKFSLLGMAILGMSCTVHAMKLGEPSVKSSIGEPLHVQFPILDSTPEELQGLRLKMAGMDAYLQRKLNVPSYLEGSTLSTVQIDGVWYVDVKTTIGVNDSAVDLLFELTWAAGTMLTQQSVLLDLPKDTTVPDSVVSLPNEETVATSIPAVDSNASAKEDNQQTVVSNHQQTVVSNHQHSSSEYTVKSGDSLSKIARALYAEKPLEKAILALYSENTQAFTGANMNRLKAGVILRLPPTDAVDNVDTHVARQTMRIQAQEWREYTSRLHNMPNYRKPLLDQKGMQGSIGHPQEVERSGDVKVVIKGDQRGSSVEKQIVAKNEKEEARSRIAELKKQLAVLEALERENKSATPLPKKPATSAPPKPLSDAATENLSEDNSPFVVVGIGGILVLVGSAGWYVYRRRKTTSVDLDVSIPLNSKEYPVLDNMLSSEDILRHAQDAIDEGFYSKAFDLLMSLPDDIRRLEDVQALIRLTSKREG